jgi:methyltransferase (TIGR00027 family)
VQDGQASRTAVLVCQGRAAANGLVPPDVYSDSVAIRLLRGDELVPVRQVLDGTTPDSGWAARLDYERVRASAGLMVPRTLVIDDAVRAARSRQLVVLGAGLDDRAWRLPELADVDVYEVDHPDSQADKRDRVGADLPVASRSLRFVPVDFTRDPLPARLADAGHDAGQPTTWLWEGVIAYLTQGQVTATVSDVQQLSAPGSVLVANYQSPSWRAQIGRFAARAMTAAARQRDMWADEPRRSSWTALAMSRLLAAHGFTVQDDSDLLTVATRRGLPVLHPRSLASGRVAVAVRDLI